APFEPKTKSEEALHDAALRQFNDFFQDRRNTAFSASPPASRPSCGTRYAMGALINILLIWLFNLRLGTHLLLRGLISFFTGTMICLIALLDHPFRGEVGVS